MKRGSGPLASRNFLLLVCCDVISTAGSAVATVALPFAVLAIGGSASDIGYVAAASLLPMVAFLLLGGVAGDRFPRHKVMMAANGLQAAAQGASAALLLTGHALVWELAVLAALRGVGAGFYYPAAQGLLPQTVADGQRAKANAIWRTGRNAAGIAGTALGGVLVGLAGPGWGLAADAASFAVAAALRAWMRFAGRPAARPAGALRLLRQGWSEFIARRWLWTVVAEYFLRSAIVSGVLTVLGPVVADASLGGARSWGLILACYGAGAVAGGMIMLRYRPERMLLAAVAAAGVFAALPFALAVPLGAPLIAVTIAVVGITSEIFVVSWFTTMQQEIPHELLSRLSAYDAMGSFALAPAGVAAAGPIAAAIGISATLVAGGALILALTIAVLAVPEVRRLRRLPPRRDREELPG